jgi:chaperone required for assembly of F1-ATPase
MKRFYKQAAPAECAGGWQVMLDGRGVKTAAGAAQVVPTLALCEALAAEWAAQGEEIVPSSFLLRDLADYAIDVVGSARKAAIATILRFAETDTLCYRAEPDEALHARQMEVWEPLVTAAEMRWDIHFTRISGVIHQPQPTATLERLKAVLAAKDDVTLAGLQTLASLSASLIVALAAIEPGADAAALWQVSELEEAWQAELWGRDAEAEARSAGRLAIFAAAMRFVQLTA